MADSPHKIFIGALPNYLNEDQVSLLVALSWVVVCTLIVISIVVMTTHCSKYTYCGGYTYWCNDFLSQIWRLSLFQEISVVSGSLLEFRWRMTGFFTALGALDYGNDLYRSVMVFVLIVTVLFVWHILEVLEVLAMADLRFFKNNVFAMFEFTVFSIGW